MVAVYRCSHGHTWPRDAAPAAAAATCPVCGDTADLYVNPALDAATVAHLRAAHTGQNSAVLGGCAGSNQGGNVARGYVTIDAVMNVWRLL